MPLNKRAFRAVESLVQELSKCFDDTDLPDILPPAHDRITLSPVGHDACRLEVRVAMRSFDLTFERFVNAEMPLVASDTAHDITRRLAAAIVQLPRLDAFLGEARREAEATLGSLVSDGLDISIHAVRPAPLNLHEMPSRFRPLLEFAGLDHTLRRCRQTVTTDSVAGTRDAVASFVVGQRLRAGRRTLLDRLGATGLVDSVGLAAADGSVEGRSAILRKLARQGRARFTLAKQAQSAGDNILLFVDGVGTALCRADELGMWQNGRWVPDVPLGASAVRLVGSEIADALRNPLFDLNLAVTEADPLGRWLGVQDDLHAFDANGQVVAKVMQPS